MDLDVEIQNYVGAIIQFSNRMYLESPVTDKEDLVQAGFIGMLSGLTSYSEVRAKETGTKKTTYVIQCIRNSILQEANKFFGATALPHNKRLKLNAFKKMIGQNKPKEEIIEHLEITDEEFEEFNGLLSLKSVVNIDSLSEDDSHSILHIDEEQNEFDDEFFKNIGMSDDEIRIIKLKMSGLTYNDIATHYNVSRETMRKRIHKAILKIKNNLKNE